MKKIIIIVMALVFLVALTQCKKEQATPANDGKTVDITLDIKSGNGTRMDVNTSTGEVTYVSGDKIYVASGGKYVGTLTHNGTRFSGAISDPTVGEPLHFYFLGNVTPAETLTAGTTTTCSVVISDQTEHLPVIEYAPSNETYTDGSSSFSAHLLNKCALVKFNVTTASETATIIKGMNNKVTVDFTDASFNYTKVGGGNINLGAGLGEKWAILLPQQALEAGGLSSAYSENGLYTGTRGAVPAIAENGYLTLGINVVVTTDVNSVLAPIGAIRGRFTINEEGDQVYFSQGNLQYVGSSVTPYWKFADNQWDYLGLTTGQNSSEQNVDRDLFGWGTSGWNNGNVYYQPYAVDYYENSQFGYGYGPTDGNNYCYDLTSSYANADWGVNNSIMNGGNTMNIWRSLSKDEWEYILDFRNTNSGIRFAKAQVNGIIGVILLPDNWSVDYFDLNNTNTGSVSFSSNIISDSQWNVLEQIGVVFLPTAGWRSRGTSVGSVGTAGFYWSSSYYDTSHAYYMGFYGNRLISGGGGDRSYGFSVRLVQDVE